MSTVRPTFSRIAAVAAGGVVMALFMASPAMADTSGSSASALRITKVGGAVVDSGTQVAANDGKTETRTGNAHPAISVLGAQTVISSGVLGQAARAFGDGTSGACAGIVGTGGTISIGSTGTCLVTNGALVSLQLGKIGVQGISIVATAIQGNCKATSKPTTSGAASLVNAKVISTTLGVETTLATLPAVPAANATVNIPNVMNLTLNAHSTAAGKLTVSGLTATAIAPTLASVRVGTVTCGPNAVAPPIPAIPLKGWPVAFGVAGVISAGVLIYRRFRTVTV